MICKAFAGVSIDGFIAGKDGSLDWLSAFSDPDGGDLGYSEFISTMDALVMGRKTFETVLRFKEWPYLLPLFVLSRSHQYFSSFPFYETLNGTYHEIFQVLEKKGYHSLYIDGGETVTGFLNAGLLDEVTVTRLPVILGEGIPLFGHLDHPVHIGQSEHRIFSNGIVQSVYSILK